MNIKYFTTVTNVVVDKQYMVHTCDQKSCQQVSFNRSIAIGWYYVCRCLQSEIKKKNEMDKQSISLSSIVNRQAWSKIVAPRFQLWKHHFSE